MTDDFSLAYQGIDLIYEIISYIWTCFLMHLMLIFRDSVLNCMSPEMFTYKQSS
jgi:hypothetical protein